MGLAGAHTRCGARAARAQGRSSSGSAIRSTAPYDPRAVILKGLSEELSGAGGDPNWFAITDAAERTVFEEKGLFPNVDLYSALGLPLPRHPDRPLHAGLRCEPHRRLGRARARAARRQQDHPAVGDRTSASRAARIRRADDARRSRGRGRRSSRRTGTSAGSSELRRAVGRGARVSGARRRFPRARGRLPRDRAVPLPHEDPAAAARARGRQPRRARLGAARAREALA